MPFPTAPARPRATRAPMPSFRPPRPPGMAGIAAPPMGGMAGGLPGQKPNFRRVGGKTIPMMADGGIGIPAPIGGGPMAGGAPAPPDMDNDQDMDAGGGPSIKPESVNYHDDAQNCGLCEYMGDDSQCAVLKMAVSPDGGCNAFEAKGGDQGEGGGAPAAGGGDTDQDTGEGANQ